MTTPPPRPPQKALIFHPWWLQLEAFFVDLTLVLQEVCSLWHLFGNVSLQMNIHLPPPPPPLRNTLKEVSWQPIS